MAWSDNWEIVSIDKAGAVRKTALTDLLTALDEGELVENKPANETGTVTSVMMAIKAAFSLQRVEAYWDGNQLLGV